MKNRTRTPSKTPSRRLSLTGGAAMPRAKREEMDRPGDEAGTTIVPGPQFDALLALIENPPRVSEATRNAAANHRWK